MVMLVVSLLLASQFLELFPDSDNARLSERKFTVETLAVHVAMELDNSSGQGSDEISELLRSTVQRNSIVKSVAVRNEDGSLLDVYGSHDSNWTLKRGDRSTPTQVQVPLFEGTKQIASVEIRFAGLNEGLSLWDRRASFLSVILFVSISGFFAFCMFLKRTLRELDPDAVIPERVKKALDTLAEGLLIVNRDGEIVFSNAEFAQTAGMASEDLAGKNCSELKWKLEENEILPWNDLLNGGEMAPAASIKLNTGYEQLSTFTVNATPIIAGANEVRGALITFNDITEVEIKNAELQNALHKLESSQLEITRQNKELEYLATRDPLTGSLNRRSFFSGFDSLFEEAKQSGDELTCIMTDIDHFKSVNDTHGHGVGDDVIKYLADVLAEQSRPNDLVGRFGGEEFCVVLPNTTINEGYEIAEKIRKLIEDGVGANFLDKCQITASFGVASIHSNSANPSEMVEHSDKALYVSKETGRNKVTNYTSRMEDEDFDPAEIANGNTAASSSVPVLKNAPVAPKPNDPILAVRSSQPDTAKDNQVQDSQPVENKPASVPENKKESAVVPLFANTAKSPVLKQSVLQTEESNIKETADETVQLPDASDGSSLRLDRSLLLDRLEQSLHSASRNNHHVSVFLITIEALNRINDILGFTVSEKLYRSIARRLKTTLKEEVGSIVGSDDQSISITRYGDTEICLALHKIDDIADIEVIHRKILEAFDRTIAVDGHEVYTALDIGISTYPEHGDNADKLIRSASIALREAIDEDGQNNICYFEEKLDTTSRRIILLETALHQALHRNELFVVYQPKVNIKTGEIIGMEALIRWRHPEMGIVSPAEFIPVAETTGLINDISAWVIRVVCAQVAIWREAGHLGLTVSVNISPAEMNNESLAQNILASINEFGIPAHALEVEITESMAMRDMDKAVRTLEKLAAAGVEISIDDFGTGYASLSYLKQFPIGKVKIDRLFVSDFAKNPSDARIVSGVIAMSHSLGMTVICEGVEEVDQLRFLQDNHCDQVQGNLLSLPLQRQEATNLLANPRHVRRLVTDYTVSELGLSSIFGDNNPAEVAGLLNKFPDSESDDSDYEDQVAAN